MDRRGAEKSREMMLEELLGYDRITIQCHDNPDADAIASGFGLYCFFRDQGKDVRLLYAGKNKVRKANLTLMVEKLGIPLKYLAHPGEEPVDVTYTYDINSILEVEVRVVSTGKTVRQVIKGQYTQMTDEEIEQRLKDLSYLKIHPRDQEENRLLLLRGERLYEESVGNRRVLLEQELSLFEQALDSHDEARIGQARERLKSFLEKLDET